MKGQLPSKKGSAVNMPALKYPSFSPTSAKQWRCRQYSNSQFTPVVMIDIELFVENMFAFLREIVLSRFVCLSFCVCHYTGTFVMEHQGKFFIPNQLSLANDRETG